MNDLENVWETTQTAESSLGVSYSKLVDSQLPAMRVNSGADTL